MISKTPSLSSSTLFAGWDIGGTKSAAVIGTATGDILARKEWPSLTQRGPQAMLTDFLTHFDTLKAEAALKMGISALGVSVGGPLDARRGVVLSPPHLPGWDDYPLATLLSERLHLPVTVEHDAAACLLAEHFWGHARGASHAAYITAGTGCGAGILIDGKILRGPDGQTPEIGHIRMAETGPKLFGKHGCVESFCSGTGLALLAQELFPQRFTPAITTRELAALAASGDCDARTLLLTGARWMGRLCALLTDLFSLQILLIGSLARYLPAWWLDAVRAEFLAEALPHNGAQTKILPAALGDRLQDLSAIAPCIATALGEGK